MQQTILEAKDSIPMNTSTATHSRKTSNVSFSSFLKEGIKAGAGLSKQVTDVAAPFVPGASTLSAALNQAAQKLPAGSEGNLSSAGVNPAFLGSGEISSINNAGAGSGTMQNMEQMHQKMFSTNMYMLGLQQKFNQASVQFTTLSNVMKAKHDTEKNSISNIR